MYEILLGPVPQLLATILFVWIVWRLLKHDAPKPMLRSVAILVLGDVGRSPRMMYHAESFAKHGFETYPVGYKGARPIASLLSLPHVHLTYIPGPPSALSGLPFIIAAPFKILHQVVSILQALLSRIPHPPEFILVQNPPSIPTLALVWFVGQWRGSKVIIDWHNLGFSILALKLGGSHPFVKLARRFEATFGRHAYAHLFVTRAMHDYLSKEWRLIGRKVVLHDRPPSHFRRASESEIHELFLRLGPSLSAPALTWFLPPSTPPYSTPFTHVTESDSSLTPLASPSLNMPTLRPDRPALVVSSTSWTQDEDFSILLAALGLYEQRAKEANGRLPKILAVVTGRGPLKERYMKEVGKLQEEWEWVRCVSLWLEAEDYPVLLGSADLGVSLHSSSSALDLPMKIVDMFGCGLPVCALDFACLHELVREGTNGLIFKDAAQLSDQLETLLTSFPSSEGLASLRSSLAKPPDHPHATRDLGLTGSEGEHWEWSSWTENWDKVMMPLILRDIQGLS
ncbi:glycosyltransferase family 33 protein [Heliocybe sulcata]|uniref:Chitobiosyldiphosphodolichol beta-mannosyltransferase n=1 Tax=Heliocybe sulcata TaxID=5364 RepID=A0A5C3MU01_9AGAM|nr:glycosyltransferase family 33 protein [Heliocybe sulcata]